MDGVKQDGRTPFVSEPLAEQAAATLPRRHSVASPRRLRGGGRHRIIDDWAKYLGDSALATTILDRLMHRSVLVEFKGRSYRLKHAASRLAKANDSE